LLMESLKIRDKKTSVIEEIIETKVEAKAEEQQQTINETTVSQQIVAIDEMKAEVKVQQPAKPSKPTFGQSLMEKVKKFFEEVE